MRSNHSLSWTGLRAFLVVLMGIAFWGVERARADEYIENISYRATLVRTLASGKRVYDVQVSCRVITDGPERNIYLRVTLWDDDWFGDDELTWVERCHPAREWERRPTGNIQTNINYTFENVSDESGTDWLMTVCIVNCDKALATYSAAVSFDPAGFNYSGTLRNDPGQAAMIRTAGATSLSMNGHTLVFDTPVANGENREVSMVATSPPPIDPDGGPGETTTTVPYLIRFDQGSSSIGWTVGPMSTPELSCGAYLTLVNPPEAVFEAGVTDVGNHGDDVVTSGIAMPFGVRVGLSTYYSARVSSNGNMQFTTASNAFVNQALPAVAVGGAMICPLWDDLRTDGVGQGIYTSTTGVAPNRRFNIEWRHGFFGGPFPGTGVVAISFYENQSYFDTFYVQTPSNGQSATIGVQADSAATMFSFNPVAPGTLTGVRAIRYVCVPPSTPSCTLVLSNEDGAVGQSVDAFAIVSPAVNPMSTGINVTLDASGVDGGIVTLRDDGIMPDGVANDGVLSGTFQVGPGATLGAHTLASTATDSLGRTSSCSTGFRVIVPPPANDECDGAIPLSVGLTPFDNAYAMNSSPADACVPIGMDSWWSFVAPETGRWIIDTCGSTGDTVLEAYTMCAGTLLACNDDYCSVQSHIEVCLHAGERIVVRLGGYASVTTSGSIRVMPGLDPCSFSCHGMCVADFDDGSGTGTPDGGVTIDDLLYYLFIFEAGQLCSDVDDGSGTGTLDGGVTIDDLLYYLVRFESGC